MRTRRAWPGCIALLSCAWLAAGCSSIPKAQAMRVDEVTIAARQPSTVGVRVSGGQDFQYRISDEQFDRALRESLVEAGVFSGVVEIDSADYRLDVVLGDDRGIEGRELTVLWNVSRVDTARTVWQELITSKGKSFHFVGVTRLRRSLEMAARENIRLGLEKLSRADLTPKAADAAP